MKPLSVVTLGYKYGAYSKHPKSHVVGLLTAILTSNAANWGTSTKLLRMTLYTQILDLRGGAQVGSTRNRVFRLPEPGGALRNRFINILASRWVRNVFLVSR